MEINQAILLSLPIKFHDDDTFIYKSPQWPQDQVVSNRNQSKLTLPLTEEVPTQTRRKQGCPKAFSAKAWLSSKTSKKCSRLFANVRLAAASV